MNGLDFSGSAGTPALFVLYGLVAVFFAALFLNIVRPRRRRKRRPPRRPPTIERALDAEARRAERR